MKGADWQKYGMVLKVCMGLLWEGTWSCVLLECLQENKWVRCTVCIFGVKCWNSTDSLKYLCVYALVWGKEMVPTMSFVPREVPQWSLSLQYMF